MKTAIDTGLAPVSAPISWATLGNDILFTAQVPFDDNGQLVGTDIREQTAQCLRNLAQTLTAASAKMDDVAQVVVFLTQLEDVAGMNEVYREHFTSPYPNRATIIVAGLTVPGMRVEMLAYAALGRPKPSPQIQAGARPSKPAVSSRRRAKKKSR